MVINSNKEISYLTGMRGVAVSLVLIAHTLPGYSFNKVIAYLGMSLFFILSGTVLAYIWGERIHLAKLNLVTFSQTFFSFIWARFARLAPLYLIVAIPYFASSVRPWDDVVALIPRYLFGMQSWFYDVYSDGSIKQLLVYSMTWSISAEVFLYLLFPFFILFLFPTKKKSNWLMITSLYLFYCFILLLLTKSGLYSGVGFPPSQTWIDWFVYLSPYGRLFEFTFGVLIGLTLRQTTSVPTTNKSQWPYHGLLAISMITILIIILSMMEAHQTTHPIIALLRMGPCFTLPICYLMMALARGGDITEKLFSTKPLIQIGTWSYSIYLFQGYGLPLFGQSWTPGISEFIKHITNYVVILLLSAGSYQLIETPARRFLLQFDPSKIFATKNQIYSPIESKPL